MTVYLSIFPWSFIKYISYRWCTFKLKGYSLEVSYLLTFNHTLWLSLSSDTFCFKSIWLDLKIDTPLCHWLVRYLVFFHPFLSPPTYSIFFNALAMILLNSIWLSLFFLNVIYYFWLCWVFALHKLFSSCGQQGYSLVVVPSHRDGFSCCESQPLEHRLSNSGARVYLPWGTWDLPGLRDRTCVSYIGRQILYHWATREALE